jgi:DNA-binding NtrC family response regulator
MPHTGQPVSARPRVLVAEPDTGLRGLMVRALEEYRYRVLGTSDLDTVPELLELGLPVALVVTNVRLDVPSNLEYLENLQAKYPRVPVMHLSTTIYQRARRVSATGFDVELFISAVRDCIATGTCDPPPGRAAIHR